MKVVLNGGPSDGQEMEWQEDAICLCIIDDEYHAYQLSETIPATAVYMGVAELEVIDENPTTL